MRRGWIAAALLGCGGLVADAGDTGASTSDASAPETATCDHAPQWLASATLPSGAISGLALHDGAIVWSEIATSGASPGLLHLMPLGGPSAQLAECGEFAVDGDVAYCFVFSTTTSKLLRVPLDGGAITTIVVAPAFPDDRVVIADATIYLETGSTIWSVVEADGTRTFVAMGNDARLIGASQSIVYWSADNGSQDAVETISATHAGSTTTLTTDGTLSQWGVMNASTIYFAGVPIDSSSPRTIYSVPITGGAKTIFAQGKLEGPVAIDDLAVYAVDVDTRLLLAIPITGGAPTPTAIHVGFGPTYYAFDATMIYWTNGAEIYRACR